jgi:hypothetical protein
VLGERAAGAVALVQRDGRGAWVERGVGASLRFVRKDVGSRVDPFDSQVYQNIGSLRTWIGDRPDASPDERAVSDSDGS